MRPPWSLKEEEFVERCERCEDCVAACPDRLLIKGRGGFPQMDFSRGGCDFCGDCLMACKGRAMVGDANDHLAAFPLKAEISAECLSAKGVVCRACGEVCDERSIRFRLEVGGIARPLLDTESCSGCGACLAVCPVQAVTISHSDVSLEDQQRRSVAK